MTPLAKFPLIEGLLNRERAQSKFILSDIGICGLEFRDYFPLLDITEIQPCVSDLETCMDSFHFSEEVVKI